MAAYILRRILGFVPTLVVVSLAVFLLIYLIPGDPVAAMLGTDAPPDQRAALRHQLGLDRSFPVRLVDWYRHTLQGDLGRSFFLNNEPISKAILQRLPVTLSLALTALVIASIVGVGAGVIASVKRGQALDWGVMVLAMLGLSIPVFALAMTMILLFAVKLRWLPVGGWVAFEQSPWEFARHLLMPGLTLGLAYAAVIARMTRASMTDILGEDYIRTAHAKGLPKRVVISRHALRNALIPILTVIGIGTGDLLAGSVITETVFNVPGIGRLVVEAVKRRDYPVVQGGILVVTLSYLIVNLVVDVLYAWVDPRIRYS